MQGISNTSSRLETHIKLTPYFYGDFLPRCGKSLVYFLVPRGPQKKNNDRILAIIKTAPRFSG